MRAFLIVFTLCFGSLASLRSQSDTTYAVEFGLNVTQTLAGFFNSGGSQLPTDPYLITLRILGEKGAFRAGANLRINNTLEFQSNGDREVRDVTLDLRGGWERRIPAGDRFTLYWGLDGVWRYEEEKVDFGTFISSNLRLRDYRWGVGGGPVLGVFFHLHRRVSLSTESSLYGIYFQGVEEEDLEPNRPAVRKDIRGFELAPAVPNSLYLLIRF